MFSPGIIYYIHGFKIKSTDKNIQFVELCLFHGIHVYFPTDFTFRSRIERFLLAIRMIQNILFLIIVNVTVYVLFTKLG